MWSPSRSSQLAQEATRRFERMQDANEYSEAYFMHGLGVQTAEASRRISAPAISAASWAWHPTRANAIPGATRQSPI